MLKKWNCSPYFRPKHLLVSETQSDTNLLVGGRVRFLWCKRIMGKRFVCLCLRLRLCLCLCLCLCVWKNKKALCLSSCVHLLWHAVPLVHFVVSPKNDTAGVDDGVSCRQGYHEASDRKKKEGKKGKKKKERRKREKKRKEKRETERTKRKRVKKKEKERKKK